MEPSTQISTCNILLADNDSDDCYFLVEALHEFWINTALVVVNNGDELMEYLNNETVTLPDLLFLDLNMPRKNGFECLTEIKLDARLSKIPVVIYSTSFHYRVAELLYKNGAHYYISKPSEITELKKSVRQIITLVAEGNTERPTEAHFVLTTERKNYQKLLWFSDLFTIPFTK